MPKSETAAFPDSKWVCPGSHEDRSASNLNAIRPIDRGGMSDLVPERVCEAFLKGSVKRKTVFQGCSLVSIRDSVDRMAEELDRRPWDPVHWVLGSIRGAKGSQGWCRQFARQRVSDPSGPPF